MATKTRPDERNIRRVLTADGWLEVRDFRTQPRPGHLRRGTLVCDRGPMSSPGPNPFDPKDVVGQLGSGGRKCSECD